MARLPVVSGRAIIAALKRDGWVKDRQSGSHVVLVKEGREEIVSVPLHDPVKKGTLLGILHDAKLTRDEFARLL